MDSRSANPCGLRRSTGFQRSYRKPILRAEKEKSSLWKKTKRIFTRDPDAHRYARTTPYLETLDKRRGYHRDPLGEVIKKNGNGEKPISPERVAEATVGKIASQAFM